MSTVHDKLTDMRRREYFYDRLLLECDRAKQTGGTFAVVVLRIATDEGKTYDVSPIQRVVEALEPLAKEYDWLAPIGVQEVAMFTPRLSAEMAPTYATELAERVTASVKDVSGIKVLSGWACYGRDLVEAGDLVGNARRMVARIDPPQIAAA
jgi:PleD family two-component response regulator